MDKNNIDDLIKKQEDRDWELFKRETFQNDNQDIHSFDDSIFDIDKFNKEPDFSLD